MALGNAALLEVLEAITGTKKTAEKVAKPELMTA